MLNKYDMKYVFKKVLIFFIIFILLSFIKSCEVKAISNEILGSGVNISDIGMIWDNSNATDFSSVGYNIGGSSDLYYVSTNQPIRMGDYGNRVTQCNLSFIENSYYSVTYYFVGTNDYFHPFYTNVTYKLAISNTTLKRDFTYFNYETVSSGIQQKCDMPNFSTPVGNCIDTFTIIFKAPQNGTCITTAYNSNNANTYFSSEKLFAGISYQNLGQKALTETEIQNALNSSFNSVNNNISSAQSSIINNNNQNTQDIITNQEENAQDIMDNQNENTDKEIESQKVCTEKVLKYTDTVTDGYISGNDGTITSASNWGVTDYLEINKLEILNNFASDFVYSCFYNENKVLISCIYASNNTGVYSLPNGTKYARFSIRNNDIPEYKVSLCYNGNQAVNDSINDLNDNINDDNVSGAESEIDSLLQNNAFNDTSGIQSIINAPLNFISGLTSSCSPIQVTIPYINTPLTIPCIKQELNNHIPTIVPILSTAINGFVIYRILIDIVYLIKSARNPDDDRIEVLDL